jgi:hypothetical protein
MHGVGPVCRAEYLGAFDTESPSRRDCKNIPVKGLITEDTDLLQGCTKYDSATYEGDRIAFEAAIESNAGAIADDCTDAGGRATPGAVAEEQISAHAVDHERNQPLTVRPAPSAALRTKGFVEGLIQRFPNMNNTFTVSGGWELVNSI